MQCFNLIIFKHLFKILFSSGVINIFSINFHQSNKSQLQLNKQEQIEILLFRTTGSPPLVQPQLQAQLLPNDFRSREIPGGDTATGEERAAAHGRQLVASGQTVGWGGEPGVPADVRVTGEVNSHRFTRFVACLIIILLR